MEPIILSAIISGIFATVGALVSFIISKQEINIKLKDIELKNQEIELKTKELNALTQKLKMEFEALKQGQFIEILKKRLESYPKLWDILVRYNAENMVGENRDEKWSSQFLRELDKCNAEIGVFFSQDVYIRFREYEGLLKIINHRLVDGNPVNKDDFDRLDKIYYGNLGAPGLATFIKDDLGSYSNVIIQARKDRT